MGSSYTVMLLLCTEVWWWSQGRVLVHILTLWSEILLFIVAYSFQLSSRLCDTVLLQRLAYLANIFTKMNKLNLLFQGTTITMILECVNIEFFLCKIEFWRTCVKNVMMFSDIGWFFEWTCESDKWWCSFRHNTAFMRFTSYNGIVFSMCGWRFSLVMEPVYDPSHRAKIINKTMWGINWYFNRHGVWKMHTQVSLWLTSGQVWKEVSMHFKCICEEDTSVSICLSVQCRVLKICSSKNKIPKWA
jgi:hypothetical protein